MENNEEMKENIETKDTSKLEGKTNTFTQEDMNNIVAKNVKEERAKILKELGIEDVDNAKKALDSFKKYQDSQKSELEKLQEDTKTKESEILTLREENKNLKNERKVESLLKDMSIDTSYSSTIFKLMDRTELTDDINDKDFKALITKTIENYLPMLKAEEGKRKVGFEKQPDKTPIGSTKEYLDTKYKNNPFYNG